MPSRSRRRTRSAHRLLAALLLAALAGAAGEASAHGGRSNSSSAGSSSPPRSGPPVTPHSASLLLPRLPERTDPGRAAVVSRPHPHRPLADPRLRGRRRPRGRTVEPTCSSECPMRGSTRCSFSSGPMGMRHTSMRRTTGASGSGRREPPAMELDRGRRDGGGRDGDDRCRPWRRRVDGNDGRASRSRSRADRMRTHTQTRGERERAKAAPWASESEPTT